MSQCKTLCVCYSQGRTRELNITLTCLVKEGIRKFDHPHPQGLSLCERG